MNLSTNLIFLLILLFIDLLLDQTYYQVRFPTRLDLLLDYICHWVNPLGAKTQLNTRLGWVVDTKTQPRTQPNTSQVGSTQWVNLTQSGAYLLLRFLYLKLAINSVLPVVSWLLLLRPPLGTQLDPPIAFMLIYLPNSYRSLLEDIFTRKSYFIILVTVNCYYLDSSLNRA